LRKRDIKSDSKSQKYGIEAMVEYLKDPVTLADKLNILHSCDILKTHKRVNDYKKEEKLELSISEKHKSPMKSMVKAEPNASHPVEERKDGEKNSN
jgi:hypothetical protein